MNSSKAPPPPSRAEIENRLVELLAGKQSREEVADWASKWIRAEEPGVDDPAVWKALNELAGADLKTIDRPYLHEEVDFRAWLEELQASP
ncbi:MAG: hypothetical protein SX243_22460 [Acidobacteriota bacterium]|nr:hypothetical protein [Acidobacteriota bacterium]